MAKNKDYTDYGVKSKKEKRLDIVIFIVLAIGAVAMVFPLVYMLCASFMTKGQILSGGERTGKGTGRRRTLQCLFPTSAGRSGKRGSNSWI